jgi:hypothetical protein
LIESYEWAKIIIDGRQYNKDVLILKQPSGDARIEKTWWREEGHVLSIFDVDKILNLLESPPDILLIGTGHDGVLKIPAATAEYI